MGRIAWLVIALVACGDDGTTNNDGGPPGDGSAADGAVIGGASCEALAMPQGRVVNVTPKDDLRQVGLAAQDGDVLVLADGTYDVTADVAMQLVAANVTLISASRDASKVIIDGGAHASREILQVGASNVTIAHVTIKNARDHAIHFAPRGSDITSGLVYGVVLVDAGQQFIKSNPTGNGTPMNHVDGVTVVCSRFEMTPAGRAYVPTNPDNASYPCYTGGIDAHAARDWKVQRNVFTGIYCDVDSLAEHAIHFWRSGRDQLIEQNTIINCARGIGLGLGDAANGGYERTYADDPHANDKLDPYAGNYDGIIRNNVIYTDTDGTTDVGIGLEQSLGTKVLNNTVVITGGAAGNAIEYRFRNSLVEIRNNIATTIRERDNARGTVMTNQLAPPLSQFVDAAAGDLHLAASAADAIDQGAAHADVTNDIDGDTRGATPDLGADELAR
ncbi:MAG: hypothetical protein AB7T06_47035 [Kofleriaceae bacterium]